MAMKVIDIQDWLNTLDEDDEVGIDEGGLMLVAASDREAYCEVGGLPEESESQSDSDEEDL